MSVGTDVDADIDADVNADIDADLSGSLGLTIAGIPNSFDLSVKDIPKLRAALDPFDLSLRLKEIPAIRVHLPVNFKFGFSIFGREVFGIRICGQAQIITEPYQPNPCECPNPALGKPVGKPVAKLGDSHD